MKINNFKKYDDLFEKIETINNDKKMSQIVKNQEIVKIIIKNKLIKAEKILWIKWANECIDDELTKKIIISSNYKTIEEYPDLLKKCLNCTKKSCDFLTQSDLYHYREYFKN